MSLPITAPTDYIGFFSISQNQFQENRLKEYITKFEEYYLKYILSDNAFTWIWARSFYGYKVSDMLDGVDWEDNNLTGLKEILIGLIYTRYVADNWVQSITGKVQNLNENSTKFPDVANKQVVYNRYNSSIDMYYNELVPFINEYSKIKELIAGFTDDGGGTYTILTASTKYLYNGDTVLIGNADYEVSNLVPDTSFEINAGVVGYSFSGQYSYKPFNFNLKILKRTWL